ncbi:MAG: ABC transporter ATP-binding protein [Candidatus Schekmanbacteria bacterium]|nr:ABC transporter ATP-binding protein [Candidatus Schekmanbacteria bacterium]
MNAGAALEIAAVTKRFGSKVAVDALSLRVERGAFVGVLGRNGAGKTTTINMATGLMPPSAGQIRVLGLDIDKHALEIKRRIGVMAQEDSVFGFLTGPQYLLFAGRIRGLSDAEVARRADELFDTLDLAPEPGTLVCDYSYGMKKKLELAAALLHGPEVLFLDEPFEGIDPVTGRTIRELLSGLQRKGVTLMMSSHVLEIVEKLCGAIAILEKGKLMGFGTVAELRALHGESESLEDLFVSLMGGAKRGTLSWL